VLVKSVHSRTNSLVPVATGPTVQYRIGALARHPSTTRPLTSLNREQIIVEMLQSATIRTSREVIVNRDRLCGVLPACLTTDCVRELYPCPEGRVAY
jgi:hypothetical protein